MEMHNLDDRASNSQFHSSPDLELAARDEQISHSEWPTITWFASETQPELGESTPLTMSNPSQSSNHNSSRSHDLPDSSFTSTNVQATPTSFRDLSSIQNQHARGQSRRLSQSFRGHRRGSSRSTLLRSPSRHSSLRRRDSYSIDSVHREREHESGLRDLEDVSISEEQSRTTGPLPLLASPSNTTLTPASRSRWSIFGQPDHRSYTGTTRYSWSDDRLETNTPSVSPIHSAPSSSLGSRGLPPTNFSFDESDTELGLPDRSTMKRSRHKIESTDPSEVVRELISNGAGILLLYHNQSPDPFANDVWPNCRSATKLPYRYYKLNMNSQKTVVGEAQRYRSRRLTEDPRLDRIPKNNKPTLTIDDSYGLPSTRLLWPEGRLPTEMFEEIAKYLDRDDIKSLRLVRREFDRHISQVLFRTVVVPFNSEIYGMLGQGKTDLTERNKSKAEASRLAWNNANGDDVYNGHGLDVFRGFGKHILKFGMSFEVNEEFLASPPKKSLTERVTSFWGSYEWPFKEYRRFDDVAGLETAADETPRMKIAFSELSKVRELALSLDNGLGWLNGPDRSIRARVLKEAPKVFGTSNNLHDRKTQAQRQLWEMIESHHRNAGTDIKTSTLYKTETSRSLMGLRDTSSDLDQSYFPFLEPRLIREAIPHGTLEVPQHSPISNDPESLRHFVTSPSPIGTGLLFSSTLLPTDSKQLYSPIIPVSLTDSQKEWLLETEWAQRAFLSSYMLSVIDNPITFQHVHTLCISQLSDRFVTLLNRFDFWNALPSLQNVTLLVIPVWRDVCKDEVGFVKMLNSRPTKGIGAFLSLLCDIIKDRPNIEKLTVGWAAGGEHAEGVHARNKHILPAPVLSELEATEDDANALETKLPRFPFVKELVFKNCWITPAVLTQFVKLHDELNLRTLGLDSVSLTAPLTRVGNGQHANNGLQGIAPPHSANGAIPQLLNFGIQAAQMQIQQLQGQGTHGNAFNQLMTLQHQLQTQLTQHIQQQVQAQAHVQQQINNPQQQQQQNQQTQQVLQNIQNTMQAANIAPPPVLNHTSSRSPQYTLRSQPREGSWLHVLDLISPGLNLSDFGSEHSRADPDRKSHLEKIKFTSCGYARLPHAGFDQSAIEPSNPHRREAFFAKRYAALSPVMFAANWALLGEIVQEPNSCELAALVAGWDLELGWKDEHEARGPEFDGLLPGGTGRFSGVVGRRVALR